jgi:hypothetical protein
MTAASVWLRSPPFLFSLSRLFQGKQAEEIETKCANRFSGFGFRCPSLFGD